MPRFNLDVDVDIDEALRYADYDDIIQFLIDNDATDKMLAALALEDDVILEALGNDSIIAYCVDNELIKDEDDG